MEKLINFLSDPVVAGAIVYLLSALLPKERLDKILSTIQGYVEKFPLIGVVVKIVRLYIERNVATQTAKRVEAATQTAQVLVEGQEQLKALGKVDSAVAAQKVTEEISKTFKLDTDTARTITERAVREMNLRR